MFARDQFLILLAYTSTETVQNTNIRDFISQKSRIYFLVRCGYCTMDLMKDNIWIEHLP